MQALLIDAQYFPPIAYFTLLSQFESVVVEKYEHYVKQTYRNRCVINTSQGPQSLVLPLTDKHGKVPVAEVKIDYSQKWVNLHLRAIRSAYGNAPFFEHYFDDIEGVLSRQKTFLFDLNFEILTMCLRWMRYNKPIQETSSYVKSVNATVSDYRGVVNPKKEEGCNSFFKSERYRQVFGSKFVDNLSIIDLIFCEGPSAVEIIRASARK